ncbi:MAG TPA: hypothetical protein VM141_01905 [Planctomycetota bacterium]|nr:hypothetical protein [Planctomycetota bacterium]
MNGPKIVVIGAGSYVFGFGLLYDAIVDHRLDGCEIHLVDLDLELAQIMEGIGRRLAREHGVSVKFSSTADRCEALPGADFVTTSVAVQLLRRWEIDRRIAEKHGLHETSGECGSISGLSRTIRDVPLVLSICRDMERLCPQATLLNTSNPLTRVVLAANRYTRISTVGFCYVALGGWWDLARMFGLPSEQIRATVAGLNHFSWFLEIRDGKTGRDLYPEVRAKADAGHFAPLTLKYLKETGYLCPTGDSHLGEFVPFDSRLAVAGGGHHGTPGERDERRARLQRIADGTEDWRPLRRQRSWERPMDYVNAVVRNKPFLFDMLNVANGEAITDFAPDMVVEVPVDVDAKGPRPRKIGALPPAIAALCRPAAEAINFAVEAAVHADIRLAHQAIDADPAIADKQAARAAFDEMLQAHADILPNWSRR